jgi:hypothetical protein
MDDGFFARWTLGSYPPLAPAALDVKGRLGPELGRQLMEALVQLLEHPGGPGER